MGELFLSIYNEIWIIWTFTQEYWCFLPVLLPPTLFLACPIRILETLINKVNWLLQICKFGSAINLVFLRLFVLFISLIIFFFSILTTVEQKSDTFRFESFIENFRVTRNWRVCTLHSARWFMLDIPPTSQLLLKSHFLRLKKFVICRLIQNLIATVLLWF